MASFQAKIGRKRMRNRETKIIVPFRSYQMRSRKFKKKNKKNQKTKKYHFLFVLSKNRLGMDEKERK